MEGLRLRLLEGLRGGSWDMGDLSDRLSVRLTDAYRELGRKALDVLDDVRAGPPGWRQAELW